MASDRFVTSPVLSWRIIDSGKQAFLEQSIFTEEVLKPGDPEVREDFNRTRTVSSDILSMLSLS